MSERQEELLSHLRPVSANYYYPEVHHREEEAELGWCINYRTGVLGDLGGQQPRLLNSWSQSEYYQTIKRVRGLKASIGAHALIGIQGFSLPLEATPEAIDAFYRSQKVEDKAYFASGTVTPLSMLPFRPKQGMHGIVQLERPESILAPLVLETMLDDPGKLVDTSDGSRYRALVEAEKTARVRYEEINQQQLNRILDLY